MTEGFVVGLDIGTTKVCAVVAEQTPEGMTRIIGIGTSPSYGVRKGMVVNIEAAVNSIDKAIQEAEEMAGVEISRVFVGISGGHVKSFNSRGALDFEEEKEITEYDIEKVLETAKVIAVPPEREVVHAIPVLYYVDGGEGIEDPKGLYASKMEVDVHIITGAVSAIHNVVKCVETAGFQVEDIVLQPLASSFATVAHEEKESGVVMIDIGGGTTDFVVFTDGYLSMSNVVAVGGDHVSNDISLGLKIPISKAEDIKIRYGTAMPSIVREGEEFVIPGVLGRTATSMPKTMLADIISLRMAEVFNIIKKELSKTCFSEKIASGIVLTGGASLLDGCTDLAHSIFQIPVRLGRPFGVVGLTEIMDSPIYATGVGLAQYGLKFREDNMHQSFRGRDWFTKVMDKVRSWFNLS